MSFRAPWLVVAAAPCACGLGFVYLRHARAYILTISAALVAPPTLGAAAGWLFTVDCVPVPFYRCGLEWLIGALFGAVSALIAIVAVTAVQAATLARRARRSTSSG